VLDAHYQFVVVAKLLEEKVASLHDR
jgi:hypothetical protein